MVMEAEERIENLIKPLINDWLWLARNNKKIDESYKKALYDLSQQLHEALIFEVK